MPITKKDLSVENSQEILKNIINDNRTKLRKFFEEWDDETGINTGRGLAGNIRKLLKGNNPFEIANISDDSLDRKINRWLDGDNFERFIAYQICIALNLGLER